MDRREDALHQHTIEGKRLTHSHEGGALPHTHPAGIGEDPSFDWYAIGHIDGEAGHDSNPPNEHPDDIDYLNYADGYRDGEKDRKCGDPVA